MIAVDGQLGVHPFLLHHDNFGKIAIQSGPNRTADIAMDCCEWRNEPRKGSDHIVQNAYLPVTVNS